MELDTFIEKTEKTYGENFVWCVLWKCESRTGGIVRWSLLGAIVCSIITIIIMSIIKRTYNINPIIPLLILLICSVIGIDLYVKIMDRRHSMKVLKMCSEFIEEKGQVIDDITLTWAITSILGSRITSKELESINKYFNVRFSIEDLNNAQSILFEEEIS